MTGEQMLWWQRGVIYQIYPRSFQDSNGDGTGVSNYTDVDAIFGDLATFDELIQQAHRYGIKVIIDFVINHSSDEHPWFLESRSSRNASRRHWYIWADAKPGGTPPNNWVSHFGGSAWEWDAATGQYYLHSFDKRQPDLNWRNPEVQAAMFDVLRFWLEHEVDGFRIDAAHMIMKDPQLRDNPVNLSKTRAMLKPMDDYHAQLHIYDTGHPDAHGIYRGFLHIPPKQCTRFGGICKNPLQGSIASHSQSTC